jgi:SAM-dependent methyltransferase
VPPPSRDLQSSGILLDLGVTQSPLTSPDVWNELHQDYEKTLVRLFSVAAKRGIELVAPQKDAVVLDVACGPGTLALMVAPLVNKVVAVDFAASMLALLEQKRNCAGLANIETLVADGTALPFADARFDAAFSCFGLFLFADRAAGFRELLRVIKPGAKAMISSWAPAEGPIEDTFRIVREILPDLPFGKGLAPLGTREDIIAEMAAAGFVDIRVEPIVVHFAFDSVQTYWSENSLASAPIVATRRRVDPTQWPAVEAQILESLRRSFPGRVKFDRNAWVAVGNRPAQDPLREGQVH